MTAEEPTDDGRATVVVHSSDIHVDDEIVAGSCNGLIGLRWVLATAAALDADIVLLAGNHDPALADSIYRRAGIDRLPQVRVLGVTHDEEIVFEPRAPRPVPTTSRSAIGSVRPQSAMAASSRTTPARPPWRAA